MRAESEVVGLQRGDAHEVIGQDILVFLSRVVARLGRGAEASLAVAVEIDQCIGRIKDRLQRRVINGVGNADAALQLRECGVGHLATS